MVEAEVEQIAVPAVEDFEVLAKNMRFLTVVVVVGVAIAFEV